MMNKYIDEVKKFFKELDGEKVKTFCIEKKRYIGAAGLLIVLIIVLACFTKPSSKKDKENLANDTETQSEELTSVVDNFEFDETYANDLDENMTNLFTNYYAAYVDSNIEELEKIAYPITDNEKSYIGVMSDYYESVSDISYYSKSGVEDGEYFVSVYNNVKFEGVETLAPTLDFFYVKTDANGNFYIDNAYSMFNQSFAESTMDSTVFALIQKYMQQSDFISIQQDTQAKYNEALAMDEDLSNMLKKTLNTAIKDWLATIQATQNSEAADTEEESTEAVTETPSETTTEAPAEEEKEEEPEVTQVKTVDIVNVREKASTDSKLLGKLTAGVVLKKLGEDGEWTIVEYKEGKDGKGYIKTEFLKPVQ